MKNCQAKLLVIQTAYLGDLIMSTVIFKNLRAIYPDAVIDVLVNSTNQKVLINNPHIRRIYVINKSNLTAKLFALIKYIYLFRQEKYDIAISLQLHLTNSLLMYLSGIPFRLGAKRQKLLTHPIVYPKHIHIRERIGLILKTLHDQPFDLNSELFPSKEDRAYINREYIHSTNLKIGFAPGSIRETKKWPFEYYNRLIEILPSDLDVYLIGGKNDKECCEKLKGLNPAKRIWNTAGDLSILQSAALIDELDLLISNDSAPLHIANAMNTPVFAFFGPTVREFGCYPYREHDKILEVDISCRPCGRHGGKKCPLGHHNCMRLITPEKVNEQIMEFLDEKRDNYTQA
jgi:heptosyltransferase-2